MTIRRAPSLGLLSLALPVLLAFAGCTATRPAGYRTFFLPPAVPVAQSAALDPAPLRMEATYYAHEIPAVLDDPARLPPPSTAEPLIRQAEVRFQEGRRLFRAGLMQPARREFDRAIDILLSGAEPGPGRHDLERKLSELSEAIHQYDISGLGANEPGAQPAFDQSPLDEIPELTFPIDPKLRDQVSEQLKATASQLPLVVSRLIAGGMDPETPAAMIQMAFWHDERVVTGTLADIADQENRIRDHEHKIKEVKSKSFLTRFLRL